jgi:hypothetical protein
MRPTNLFSTLTHTGGRSGVSDVHATGPLLRHPQGQLALRKVRYVRRFFPELDDLVLKVGLTRRAAGFADLEGLTLWLNPKHLSLHTIAHELVHLLQGRSLVPGGERSCDVYALARDVSLVDALPYYLRLPASLAGPGGWLRPGAARRLHELAREAVTRRAAGLRQYIRWFETEAQRIASPEARVSRPRARPERLL